MGDVDTTEPGTYQLIYNYTDVAGNATQTVTRTIEVVDTTAPVIVLNGDATNTHEAGMAYMEECSWTDAVDGNGVVVGVGDVDTTEPGTYQLITAIRMLLVMQPKP